ncbi:hypothetical protein B0T19DRAFT_407054 [Cercophora scortea]|uniref:Uncharacterized protein n=1 Tax=Cercophora scortea TaxID=314031 RepID=A0AAE0J2C8_9PEZI|nr:hypothetical protein B0T19DRAFT_407054 [Cercophora scortea]
MFNFRSLMMGLVQIEHTIYPILSPLAMPLFWLETLLFWMLDLPTSTSFRMFRRPDTVPEGYTDVAYSYTLLAIMLIPYFVSWDRTGCRSQLGELLRPLTRGARPLTEYAVMFARVWLLVAWYNLAVAQFMADPTEQTKVFLFIKISCFIFIL